MPGRPGGAVPPDVGGGRGRRRLDRPDRRDRRGVGRTGRPDPGAPHAQPRPRRGPQRGGAPRARRLPGLPGLRRPAPPAAYATLVRSLEKSGSDFVTGSMLRLEDGEELEPPWMHRLHHPPLARARIADRPEILGDVFAWNKLFRTLLLERQRPGVAGGGALRGPAGDDPRLPRRPLRRPARGRLPLADPDRRHLDHPAAGLGRRPARPVADQAGLAGLGPRPRRPGGDPGLRRPGAGR